MPTTSRRRSRGVSARRGLLVWKGKTFSFGSG
jgi:hypothetical protein